MLCYFPSITNVFFGIFHPILEVLIFFSPKMNGDEGIYIRIMGLALIYNEINV